MDYKLSKHSGILEEAIQKCINYSGKLYEGKPHVQFDEGSRESGLESYCALVLLYNVRNKKPERFGHKYL